MTVIIDYYDTYFKMGIAIVIGMVTFLVYHVVIEDVIIFIKNKRGHHEQR